MSSSSSASLHSAVCRRNFNHRVLATVKKLSARVSGATLCPTVTISKAGCDISDRFASECHCHLEVYMHVWSLVLILNFVSFSWTSSIQETKVPIVKQCTVFQPPTQIEGPDGVGLLFRGMAEIRSIEMCSFHGEQMSSFIETSRRTVISRII